MTDFMGTILFGLATYGIGYSVCKLGGWKNLIKYELSDDESESTEKVAIKQHHEFYDWQKDSDFEESLHRKDAA